MKLVDKISVKELSEMAAQMHSEIVKAVVDVDKKIMAIDAGMHADLEAYLLEKGSSQESLWGINLHPANFDKPDFIEYDSMINLRPRQNNLSRGVEDGALRGRITKIVSAKVA